MIDVTEKRLPVTVEEFDKLVEEFCEETEFKDKRHVAAVFSIAIRHLPNDQGYTTFDYLNNCVIKSRANHVCNHKSQVIQHETQVEMLVSKLEQDPNDMQARDELTKAAGEGSESAKAALVKIDGPQPLASVTHIHAEKSTTV